jgi:hypothetical protein
VNTWWMLRLAPEEPGQRLPLVREQLHGRPMKRRGLHESFGSGSGSCFGSNINFVWYSWHKFYLRLMLGCSLWVYDPKLLLCFSGEYFFYKEETILCIENICREIVKFYKFSRVVLVQIHFGSGASRIRIRNDLFGSGSKPCKSFGSDRIRFDNTGYPGFFSQLFPRSRT